MEENQREKASQKPSLIIFIGCWLQEKNPTQKTRTLKHKLPTIFLFNNFVLIKNINLHKVQDMRATNCAASPFE